MPDDSDNKPKKCPRCGQSLGQNSTSVPASITRDAQASTPETTGVWGASIRARARKRIETIMEGKGGRNAVPQLSACKLILSNEFIGELSDEELLDEVRRRTDLRKAAAALTKPPEGEHS